MQSAVVLGVDFGGSKIAATVADLSAKRLGSTVLPTVPSAGALTNLNRGIDACRALVERVAPGWPLVAVGAATFGIPHEDRVELAPTIDGWANLAFGRELRAAFPGAQLRISTDVKAAAQFEANCGALMACDPGVYLNLGTGLAAAVVVHGVVLAGRHGAAGEIGYNLRFPADVRQARPVILEHVVSGRGLAAVATSVGQPASGAEAVFTRALVDSDAAHLVDEFIAELAMHLVNLTALIDPERIAVGGGIAGSWEQLQPRLQSALSRHTPFAPSIVRAQHPFDAPMLGALHTALEAGRALCSAALPKQLIDRSEHVAERIYP